MTYCLSCRVAGTWGCARLCVALKMCHDMGNLWTNYWKCVLTLALSILLRSPTVWIFCFISSRHSSAQDMRRRCLLQMKRKKIRVVGDLSRLDEIRFNDFTCRGSYSEKRISKHNPMYQIFYNLRNKS